MSWWLLFVVQVALSLGIFAFGVYLMIDDGVTFTPICIQLLGAILLAIDIDAVRRR